MLFCCLALGALELNVMTAVVIVVAASEVIGGKVILLGLVRLVPVVLQGEVESTVVVAAVIMLLVMSAAM